MNKKRWMSVLLGAVLLAAGCAGEPAETSSTPLAFQTGKTAEQILLEAPKELKVQLFHLELMYL